ncbi:MAG: nucleotidyltransferase domain-containing protein [Gammaproteobacteria bacterium]|nr:nucleotidyltransferase domain-containing protein [Gammaproteobacteria bacterium]
MKLKPQGRLEGSWLGVLAQSRAGVIASNWLLQGMRYMNAYEIGMKLALDVLATLLLVWIFDWWGRPGMILSCLLAAHSLNWIFNGHFFVLMRYVYPVPKTEEDFDRYVQRLKEQAARSRFIDGVAIYGSFCRGQLHEFSDLDVRVIVRSGFINGVAGAWFCLRERFMALFMVFPLDVYCCIGTRGLERLREDEHPVILQDRSGLLDNRYGHVTAHRQS